MIISRHAAVTISFFDSIPFLLSPLLYFYIFLSLNSDIQPKVPFLVHLIPAFLSLISHFIFLVIYGSNDFSYRIIAALNGYPPLYVKVILLFKLISGLFYSILIITNIACYKEQLKNSSNKSIRTWFYLIASTYFFTWVSIITLAIILNSVTVNFNLLITAVTIQIILFLSFIYIISIFSQLHPSIFSYKIVRSKFKNIFNLTENEILNIMDLVYQQIYTEKIYIDPNVTLKELADKIHIHENILSFVINDGTKKNFSNFINKFRIDHFLDLVKNGKLENETILSLAHDSGFNSKSSFNRVFKSFMNTTPSHYIKNIIK